jgi:hypothetical protein
MKKRVLIFIIIALITNSLSAIGIDSDWNNESISDGNGTLNPANLGYRDEDSKTFDSFLLFDDIYGSDNVGSYLQYPESRLGATFYGTNLSLSLEVNNYLTERDEDDEENVISYKGFSKYSVGIDWGYKFGDLALGLSINGGSQSIKSDFELRSNAFALSDYVVETFFSRYQTVSSSQFFNLGFGGRYEFDNRIAIAFISEGEFDVNSSSITDIDLSEYFSSLCIGISDISAQYSFAGELNPVRVKFFADMLYIGDNDNRETRISSEFRFQLSKDFYSSLYLGLQEQQPALIDIFSIDPEEAKSHYGLAFNWSKYNLLLNVSVPFEFYSGDNDSDDVINATVKFTYET